VSEDGVHRVGIGEEGKDAHVTINRFRDSCMEAIGVRRVQAWR